MSDPRIRTYANIAQRMTEQPILLLSPIIRPKAEPSKRRLALDGKSHPRTCTSKLKTLLKATGIWAENLPDETIVVVSQSIRRSIERNWNDLKGRVVQIFSTSAGQSVRRLIACASLVFTFADFRPFPYYFYDVVSTCTLQIE